MPKPDLITDVQRVKCGDDMFIVSVVRDEVILRDEGSDLLLTFEPEPCNCLAVALAKAAMSAAFNVGTIARAAS